MIKQGSMWAGDFTQEIFEIWRKNLEALSQAQSALIEGNSTVLERQSKILGSMIEQALSTSQLETLTDPKMALANQFDTTKKTLQSLIGNANILSELCARSNGAVVSILETRMMDALDECKQVSQRLGDTGSIPEPVWPTPRKRAAAIVRS